MLGHHLFTPLLELVRHFRPRIVGLDERSALVTERAPPLRIPQQSHDSVRKGSRIVGGDEMPARFERQPFCAKRRGHDCFAHCEGFKNFEPRTAACSQRHHIDRPFANRRPHVVNGSRHDDARTRRHFPQTRSRVATDDGQRGAWHLCSDSR